MITPDTGRLETTRVPAARLDPAGAHAIPHAPTPIGSSKAWTTARLRSDPRWTLAADGDAHGDALRLSQWAAHRAAPEQDYMHGALGLPALHALGARIGAELRDGCGVVRVTGLDPSLDDATLRMVYLATGLAVGDAMTQYGRLFDVKDRGEDYRTTAVPVSMTRESTSFHTDSSARDVEPDHVGLLCLQPAAQGGESLVSSAFAAHDALCAAAPEALALLYADYHRDVVTPGTERNLDRIRENRFPIFRADAHGTPTFRYMRYWIERAHALLGAALSDAQIAAFDLLDAQLAHPESVLSFTLQRGEMLWVDNRSMAHNRNAFIDDPAAPRTLVRMWTTHRRAEPAAG